MLEENNNVQNQEPNNEIFSSNENNIETNNPEISKKSKDKLPLILSSLALLGVLILLIMQFSNCNKKDKNSSVAETTNISNNLKIAYINNDSILLNFELVKAMRKQLEDKTKRYENEISSQLKTIEKEAAYFEEQVSKQTISNESAQEIYGQLMQKQQNINNLRERYALELQKEELELNISLVDTVTNFLTRYNKEFNFDYILGYTKGGNIFYANDTLDITKQVLNKLNDEYKNSSK